MKSECVAAATVLVVMSAMGCSSGTAPDNPDLGLTSPGVAQLTIDGTDVGRIEAVRCAPIKHLTAIAIGGEPPTVVATISSIDELTLKWVRFHDVNGFTGSYNNGLGGNAQVTTVGSVYQISGIASGFSNQNPSQPTTASFAIEVSC